MLVGLGCILESVNKRVWALHVTLILIHQQAPYVELNYVSFVSTNIVLGLQLKVFHNTPNAFQNLNLHYAGAMPSEIQYLSRMDPASMASSNPAQGAQRHARAR